MSELWPVAELLPHDGNMVLLDELIEDRPGGITVGLTVREDGLFDCNGQVPSWVGIEYMAQAVAAFAGLQAKRAGEPVKLGFLVGTRRYSTERDHFVCGERLTVTADEVMQSENGLDVFECTVCGEEISITANLNVFQPESASTFLQTESTNEISTAEKNL